MSRSVKVKKRRWENPEDEAYLSFFGTLLHSLKLEAVRLPLKSFELIRVGVEPAQGMVPVRRLYPVPTTQMAVSELQTESLKAVAWAAGQAGFEPKALPGPRDMLTIDMVKVSDGRVPVYAPRREL
jgi:hypothetical protein